MRKSLVLPAMAAGLLAAVPGTALAAPATLKPVLDTLTAPTAVARSCEDNLGSSLLGVARTSYVAPMSGYVTVRGDAPRLLPLAASKTARSQSLVLGASPRTVT